MTKQPATATPSHGAADDNVDCGEAQGDIIITNRFSTVRPLDERTQGAREAKAARETEGSRKHMTGESAPVTSPERSISQRLRSLAPTVFMTRLAHALATSEAALLTGCATALLVFTTACAATNEPTTTPASRIVAASFAPGATLHADNVRHEAASLTPAQRAAVAQVRKATAMYERLDVAQGDGFTSQFPAGCAASPAGAQGIHYLNPARVDTLIELLRPELVMYEPQRDGRLALVGVDYVVPFSAWTHDEPPRLLGVPFMRNEKLGVWALHIWNFRTNPSGTFAMWNPRVSCAFAAP